MTFKSVLLSMALVATMGVEVGSAVTITMPAAFTVFGTGATITFQGTAPANKGVVVLVKKKPENVVDNSAGDDANATGSWIIQVPPPTGGWRKDPLGSGKYHEGDAWSEGTHTTVDIYTRD